MLRSRFSGRADARFGFSSIVTYSVSLLDRETHRHDMRIAVRIGGRQVADAL